MKSYIHLYRTNSEFTEVYNGPDYDEPWLSLTEENMDVNYNKTPPEPPKELTAITFGTITWVTDIPATGGTATKDNCTYTIIARYIGSRPEDITSQVDDVTGELAVEETTIEQRHEAGQLTLSASYCGFTATGNVTVYQEAYEKDYSKEPLTFNIISGGTIVWSTEREDLISRTISYSIDNGETWNSIVSTQNGSIINVNDGDKVMFKGDNMAYGGVFDGYPYSCQFYKSTAKFELEGNIMSLIDSTNFATAMELTEPYTFARMFYKIYDTWDGLLSIENLVLPATTLSNDCYSMMFNGCTSLTACTSLPATTLAYGCYSGMFAGCTSLVNAPELPATTLAEYCYGNMFAGCTSLTEVPELLATTLAEACYSSMFFNCTSLVNAPELPATTLAGGCYIDMFNGCSSLNYIKCLATDISADYCTLSWTNGVASTGTFVKDSTMEDWEIDSSDGIPEGWTVVNYGTIMLSKTYSLVAEEGGTVSLTVNSQENNWTATTDCNWITISQVTGNTGDTTITITVSQTDTPRGCEITFSDGEFNTKLNIVEATPLTFDIISGGTIYWNDWLGCPIRYSSDNGNTWSYFTEVSVNSGDKIMFVGDNDTYYDIKYSNSSFGASENTFFNAYGNIMSLIDSKYFYTATTLTETGGLGWLFSSCVGLVSAENLMLPATTLPYGGYCYEGMFAGCTSLIAAPVLPATTLDYRCYANMFTNCTSLINAPALPATTLATECYYEMFANCTSLTTAPLLPASVLEYGCYRSMFNGCTSLNYIKCLAIDVSEKYCTQNWVNSVSPTGTFEKNITMENWEIDSVDGIPEGWSVENTGIGVSKNLVSFDENGGEVSITVSSVENNWSAINENDWISLSVLTGTTGNTTVLITVQEFSNRRNGRVIFTDGNFNCYITVFQASETEKYLTFNIISAGTISWMSSSYNYTKDIEYSKNGGEWNWLTASQSQTKINVNPGDKIMFKGDNSSYASGGTYTSFNGSTAKFEVEGNIMSLIDSTNFESITTLSSPDTFYHLFVDCDTLISARNLILPATTLSSNCYGCMFQGCTSLTDAPELPATTLAYRCYYQMFIECTSLTQAPELPATTLAEGCYSQMFFHCTSLTQAPELPATTLAEGCYSYMFNLCESLNYIKCLATDISAYECTNRWVYKVSSTGTFVKNPNMTGWTAGTNGIPNGWTIQDAS